MMIKKDLDIKIKKIKLLALDFDGVLTDGFVYVDQMGREMVRCSRRDTLGLGMLKNKGIEVVVISKEKNSVVKARCKKMQIKCWAGVDSGNNKLFILKKIVKKLGLNPDNVCYVGDDVNDLFCIKYAGFGVTVADGDKKNKKEADYITKRKGGEHAVREICNLILSIIGGNY
jgi:3-deoxy-D-manno-octulosonate 8-phosphate phosphatase (KDO 8-P phosphatase)